MTNTSNGGAHEMPPKLYANSESHKAVLGEITIVLVVAFATWFAGSWFVAFGDPDDSLSRSLWYDGLLNSAIGHIIAVLLGVYVIRRSGKPLSDFGLSFRPRLLPYAVLLYFAAQVLWAASAIVVFSFVDDPGIAKAAKSAGVAVGAYYPPALVIFSIFSVAMVEEFVARAYLMTRLEHVGFSTTTAVVASAFIQSSYHIHHGYGLIGTFMGCLLLSAYFAWKRDVWTLIAAHMIIDFVGIYEPVT